MDLCNQVKGLYFHGAASQALVAPFIQNAFLVPQDRETLIAPADFMDSRRFIPSRSFVQLALSTVLLASTAARGQVEIDEGEVYELSPFIVQTEGDRGYLATNAISGTSLNMAIRDIPIPLEVVNRELIEDLQATDFREALAFSAGVYLEDRRDTSGANPGSSAEISPSTAANLNNVFTNTIQIRGYNVPNQQRAGFRVGSIVPKYGIVLGGMTDTANIERLEIVRGPASLLYGINVLSGIVNIIPRRPLSEHRQTLDLSFGSDSFYRAAFDATGPIRKDRLNFRIIGAYQERGDWTDHLSEDRRYLAGQLEWFVTPRVSVYVEAQYGRFQQNGFGPQYFRDNLAGAGVNSIDVRNPYFEPFQFGRDFTEADAERFLEPKPGKEYTFPHLGDGYRISGPDTSYKREEFNAMATLTLVPVDGLNIELGGYYTDVKEDRLLLNMDTFTNTRSVLRPRDSEDEIRRNPITGEITFFRPNEFRGNPEFDPDDPLGYGPGELFVVPNLVDRLRGIDSTWDNRKFGYYYWYEQPSTAETLQLRGRFAYTFETDAGTEIEHTVIGGYQYVKDEVSFVIGAPAIATTYTVGKLDEDPLFFRNIFDYSVIRYEDQPLAIPGNVMRDRLGPDGPDLRNIARSGWFEADLEYKGFYGIYQARMFNDRLTVIAGARRDSYDAEEREYLRALDIWTDSTLGTTLTGEHWGTSQFPILDHLVGFGDRPYVWNPDFPDELNLAIESNIDRLRETMPDGTILPNFERAQRFTSVFGGVSYRISEPLSVYAQYSEGVFPNTGQRDGAYESIPAEQTSNTEIGVKFDFFDRRVSGTISLYRIERENAVYRWNQAPNPGMWYGGANGPPWDTFTGGNFDPAAARGEPGAAKGNAPVTYGVARQYVAQAFEEFGLGSPPTGSGSPVARELNISTISSLNRASNIEPAGTAVYYFVPYDLLEDGGVMQRAFDLAIRDREFDGMPIHYFAGPDIQNFNSPSNSVGAPVTFEEEATGVDGQIVFSPTNNYQLLFSFSHQNRKVVGNGFNLVDPVDIRTGERYSTEYDMWVYVLGPDAFDDPSDPTTTNGKGVNGLDLSFTPSTSLSLWNKYTFTDGALAGLEIAGGARYNGSAPTSIPIGGTDLSINEFPTPPTKSRIDFASTINYTFDWNRVRIRTSLSIRNLFNQRSSENVVTYTDRDGGEQVRRSRVQYGPRTWRLSVTASF